MQLDPEARYYLPGRHYTLRLDGTDMAVISLDDMKSVTDVVVFDSQGRRVVTLLATNGMFPGAARGPLVRPLGAGVW